MYSELFSFPKVGVISKDEKLIKIYYFRLKRKRMHLKKAKNGKKKRPNRRKLAKIIRRKIAKEKVENQIKKKNKLMHSKY